MSARYSKLIPALALLGLLASCVGTTYSPAKTANRGAASGSEIEAPADAGYQENIYERRVIYDLDPRYHRDPPACAVVLPADRQSAASALAPLVDEAVATHAAGSLDRVIAPRERDRRVRALAVDLHHPGDQQTFARATRCRAILTWRLTEASQTYAVALSSRRIGLQLTLTRIGQTAPLWQAEHIAARSDGGVSLNPFGLLIDSIRAGKFNNDRDIMPSMIHDVVRRMLTTLPASI